MPRPHRDLRTLEPQRICLIKPSSLGDVVHAMPTLAALRTRWPNAHLAWVVNRGLSGLVDGHPMIDEVIPFDRASARVSARGLTTFGTFLGRLRRGGYDVAIDLQGLFRSGLMTAATGAPVRVGLARAREAAPVFYTHRIEDPENRPHAVDRLLAVAEAFGADIAGPRFVVAMTEDDRRWARSILAPLPRPRVLLNVGARWLTKRWPPARFAAVARRAHAERGAGLVAVGAGEDRPLVDELIRTIAPIPVLDLCGATTLPRLAALAAEADVFVSNDTGPLHLAAATGAVVVGIYTCTRPEWTGPYGPNARVVRTGVWCAGRCVKACDRLDCMTELDAERVWNVVREALDGQSCRTPAPSAA